MDNNYVVLSWPINGGVHKLPILGDTYLNPLDITANGQTIVGSADDASESVNAVKWVGLSTITALASANGAQAFCESQDGSVIAGVDANLNACYWTDGGTTFADLPLLDGDTVSSPGSTIQAISDDGSVIVGSSGSPRTAVTWTNGVVSALPAPAIPSRYSIGDGWWPTGCSPDGSTLVFGSGELVYTFFGYFLQIPVYWSGGTAYVIGSDGEFATLGSARFCNGDGTILYGGTDLNGPTFWTDLADGTATPNFPSIPSPLTDWTILDCSRTNDVCIGYGITADNLEIAIKCTGTSSVVLPDIGFGAKASSCSHDGSIVIGYADTETDTVPCYWDSDNVIHILPYPTDGSAYSNSFAIGINADNSTIFGVAFALSPPTPEPPPTWAITSSLDTEFPGAVGDVWANDSYIDFSDPNIRAEFENADGSWLWLGSYGERATGTSPLLFLTVQEGAQPSDILIGYGQNQTQSHWSLTVEGIDPATGQPYPAMSFDVCGPTVINNLELTDIQVTTTTILPVTFDDLITLRWSDDAGASWSNGLLKSLGKAGEYFTTPTWYRLGMARNRIIELSWSGARAEALQGCFVEVTIAAT